LNFTEFDNDVDHIVFVPDDGEAARMERRMVRTAMWTVVVAVAVSACVAPWRVTTGLLVGGVLSFFNHRWLAASVRQMFAETENSGARPRLRLAGFVWRHLVIAVVVGAAYLLNLVSLTATLIGLCSFIVAGFIEALTQIYFMLIKRREM